MPLAPTYKVKEPGFTAPYGAKRGKLSIPAPINDGLMSDMHSPFAHRPGPRSPRDASRNPLLIDLKQLNRQNFPTLPLIQVFEGPLYDFGYSLRVRYLDYETSFLTDYFLIYTQI